MSSGERWGVVKRYFGRRWANKIAGDVANLGWNFSSFLLPEILHSKLKIFCLHFHQIPSKSFIISSQLKLPAFFSYFQQVSWLQSNSKNRKSCRSQHCSFVVGKRRRKNGKSPKSISFCVFNVSRIDSLPACVDNTRMEAKKYKNTNPRMTRCTKKANCVY